MIATKPEYSRQDLFGRRGTGALAVPFMMFAEAGKMFFDLSGEFGESGFAGGGKMLAFFRGVERGGGEHEIQRQAELLCARQNGKDAVKLNKIRIKTFQKLG